MTTEAPRRRRRPFGLYAVIVLLLAQNTTLVIDGDEVRFGIAGILPADADLDRAAVALSVALGVAILIAITGLWRLKRWAWVATMVLVGAGLTVGIIQYFREAPLYWTMITNVFIVFYLNQRDVQDGFERRRPRELRA